MTNAAVAHINAEPQRQHEPSRERHLRALPTPSVRRAPRLVHGVLALAGLAGIVAAQLGLTVVISEGAYTLSGLNAESNDLARSEQSLGEDVAVLSSPQHVAVAADELGMLAGQPSQFLTLSGEATAGGPDALHMQAPALDQWGMYVPNALLQTQPQVAASVEQVAEEAVEPYPGMLLPAVEGSLADEQPTGVDGTVSTEQPAPGTLLPAAAAD